jgi:diacylglycerol kinase (ATP)
MSPIKLFRNIFRLRGFRQSLALAVKGIGYLILYHRNMRIIFLLGILAAALGLLLELRGIELGVLCLTVTLVFMAEIFNTAIELLMDILTDDYHVMIKVVKDIAAAVVLLASLNAVAVGVILFGRRLLDVLRSWCCHSQPDTKERGAFGERKDPEGKDRRYKSLY